MHPADWALAFLFLPLMIGVMAGCLLSLIEWLGSTIVL